jgi:hypothetical protein
MAIAKHRREKRAGGRRQTIKLRSKEVRQVTEAIAEDRAALREKMTQADEATAEQRGRRNRGRESSKAQGAEEKRHLQDNERVAVR